MNNMCLLLHIGTAGGGLQYPATPQQADMGVTIFCKLLLRCCVSTRSIQNVQPSYLSGCYMH